MIYPDSSRSDLTLLEPASSRHTIYKRRSVDAYKWIGPAGISLDWSIGQKDIDNSCDIASGGGFLDGLQAGTRSLEV